MTEELRAAYDRLIKLGDDILRERHWGADIKRGDAKRQDDALAALGYEAGQIAKLLAAPAQPEPKVTTPTGEVTTPGQSHQLMGEPAALKDGQVAALVNELRDIAIKFHGAGQLRERIAQVIRPLFRSPPAASTPAVPEPSPGAEGGERRILDTYDKLHEGKIGAHWLWCVIEQIAAGVPEDEAMREFGYYERAAAPVEGEQKDEPVDTGLKLIGTVTSEHDSDLVFRVYTKNWCRHEWVDARNEHVLSGELCTKCGLLRSGNHPAASKEKA